MDTTPENQTTTSVDPAKTYDGPSIMNEDPPAPLPSIDSMKADAIALLDVVENQLLDAITERDMQNARIKELRPEVARIKTIIKGFTPRTRKAKS